MLAGISTERLSRMCATLLAEACESGLSGHAW